MITIHNFKEACQQYQHGLITYRLVQDQATVMLGLCSNPSTNVVNSLEITDSYIHWVLQRVKAALDYSEFLGGYIYVFETETDLLQIYGCDFEWAEAHHVNWPNVTELAMSWDSCCYLDELAGEPQWVIFLSTSSDLNHPHLAPFLHALQSRDLHP